MKKISFILACLLTILSLSFFRNNKNHCLAEVEKIENIYIFVRCKPVTPYTSLGRINMPEFVMSNKPAEKINTAIKRVKKQYPKAQALFFYENMDKVEAIKFNE